MGITCSSRAPLPILAIHAAVERNAAEAARSRAEEDLAARARAEKAFAARLHAVQAALRKLMLDYGRSRAMFSYTDLQSPASPAAFTGGDNSEFRKDSSVVAIVSTPPVNMNPSPPETNLTEDPVNPVEY